jgi:hypothetical protein
MVWKMNDFSPMGGLWPETYRLIYNALRESPVVETGEWHAQQVIGPAFATHELQDVTLSLPVNWSIADLQRMTQCNLPWAEDHFQERVSKIPFNPPPSHVEWPFGNTDIHLEGEKFSHTYPERFWPSHAGYRPDEIALGRMGIRFEYGDLNDLVRVLVNNPLTRQAYLPVWFPEDLSAAIGNHRVPCSLGYHFMIRNNCVTVRYYMRSCEYLRHLADDMYLAGRLLQWVTNEVNELGRHTILFTPLRVIAHITSLHLMVADVEKARPA